MSNKNIKMAEACINAAIQKLEKLSTGNFVHGRNTVIEHLVNCKYWLKKLQNE